MKNSDIAIMKKVLLALETYLPIDEKTLLVEYSDVFERFNAKNQKEKQDYQARAEYYRGYTRAWKEQNPEKTKQYREKYSQIKKEQPKKKERSAKMPSKTGKNNREKKATDRLNTDTKPAVGYNSGADMWLEYLSEYGETEARGICNRYLNMQIFNKNPEEQQFCKELYAAMQETVEITKDSKTSVDVNEIKSSILNDLAEKKQSAAQQSATKKTQKNENEL